MSQAFAVTVTVRLKPGVLDPQGKAIEQALAGLGHTQASDLRQSKLFEFQLEAANAEAAATQATAMAEDLLANTVIESYSVEVA